MNDHIVSENDKIKKRKKNFPLQTLKVSLYTIIQGTVCQIGLISITKKLNPEIFEWLDIFVDQFINNC